MTLPHSQFQVLRPRFTVHRFQSSVWPRTEPQRASRSFSKGGSLCSIVAGMHAVRKQEAGWGRMAWTIGKLGLASAGAGWYPCTFVLSRKIKVNVFYGNEE